MKQTCCLKSMQWHLFAASCKKSERNYGGKKHFQQDGGVLSWHGWEIKATMSKISVSLDSEDSDMGEAREKNNNWHILWLVCLYVRRFQALNHLSLKLTVLDGGRHKDNIYFIRTSSSFQGIAGETRRLEASKRWWGDPAGLAYPQWWKGYSIQWNIIISSGTGVVGEKGERQVGFQKQPSLREWLGTTLLVQKGKWLLLHHFLHFFPLFPPLKLSLCQLMSFMSFALPSFSPVLLG